METSKTTPENNQKEQQILKDFLLFCEPYTNNHSDQTTLERHIEEAKKFKEEFFFYLSTLPLITVISYWLKHSTKKGNINTYAEIFKLLIREKIFSIQKKSFILESLKKIGHEEILESIRCLNLSLNIMEKTVETYLIFAKFLSEISLDYIPYHDNLDPVKKVKKKIPYEVFAPFAKNLPQRDCLIAQLIYFSEPSMADVLELKPCQINFTDQTISFGHFLAKYPRRIMQSLQEYIADKKTNELVFTNRLGQLVNRSRLYASFKNASAKLSPPGEIAPKDLLEKLF